MSGIFDAMNEFFDEDIPDEVLNDESWEPRFLPTTNDLTRLDHSFDDMIDSDEDEY